MKEAELYPWITAGLLHERHAVHKIVDGSLGKKPADFMGCTSDGRGLILEAKIVNDPTATEADFLRWGRFETHQAAWLRGFAARGAVALAFVYVPEQKMAYVWRVRDANDLCARPADLLMPAPVRGAGRTALRFIGWAPVTGALKGAE